MTDTGSARSRWRAALAGLSVVMALSGCERADLPEPVRQAVSDAPMDAALFSGDVMFSLAERIEAQDRALPVTAYFGLSSLGDTRLGIKAAVDLRDIQRDLPSLLSGRLDPDCGLGIELGLTQTQAEGDAVRARGTVKADLYRCKGRDTEKEARGAHLWTQLVDFDAVLGAGLTGECVGFELRELTLDPRGFLGGLGTAFGITEKVRKAILDKGNAALRDTPICPDMPPTLERLSPDFGSGGAIEIGDGGLGAALSGTVETDAERLVGLMALWQEKGFLPGSAEGLSPLQQGAVTFRFDQRLETLEPPVPYRLDLGMSAVAPTRIGLRARLDLSALQERLPELVEGALLVDDCSRRIELRGLETIAQAKSLVALARLEARSFTCERTGDSAWQRGALEHSEEVDVRAEVSASLSDNCAVFELIDIARDPPLPVISEGRQGARTQAARTLFIDAVDALLKDRPLCPDLPEELRVLDPQFSTGGPVEIGNGGLGFGLEGSVDLSTGTMIAILTLLQERGVLPPRP